MSKRVGALAALLVSAVCLSTSALWRRRPPAPKAWTGPFTPAEYQAFLKVIALYFGVRRVPISVKEGELTIEGADGPHRELLGELAELCHRHDRSQWPDLVARHFAAEPAPGEGRAAFAAVVQAYFRQHGLEATVEDEAVVARDALGRVERYEVAALRARCDRVPEADWPELVAHAFTSMRRAREAAEAQGEGFAEARELLAVMLVGEGEWTAQRRVAAICSEELPGLTSLVVWRLPGRAEPLTREQAERWGVPPGEVMAAARANLRRLRPPAEQVTLVEGVEALRLQGEGDFVASQALLLAEEPAWCGAYGALVALPRRGALIICPLGPMARGAVTAAGAVMSLIVRIQQMAAAGPAPLVPNLYWYHEGRFTGLPYTLQREGGRPRIDFQPPQAFAAALVALRGGDAR